MLNKWLLYLEVNTIYLSFKPLLLFEIKIKIMTTTMTTNFGFFAFTVNNFLGEHSLILDNIYSLSSLIYNIEKYILLSSVSLLPLPFIFLSGSGKKYLGQGIKYGSGILASYGATKQSLPP